MGKLRTLKDVRDGGLDLLAVCHNVSCRHTRQVDLDKLIKAAGELASLLPVKDQSHFSERMRCPECRQRGMFIWIDQPKEPNPISVGPLAFRVITVDRETDRPMFDVLRAGDRQVAQAGFEMAEAIYPRHKIEMLWHRRVIHSSHMSEAERKVG